MQCIRGIAVSHYFRWLFFIVICLTGGLNFSVLASGFSSSRTQTVPISVLGHFQLKEINLIILLIGGG